MQIWDTRKTDEDEILPKASEEAGVVDQAIDDMLEANTIRRSKSPWSFPIVVVDKKDGIKPFCVDFREFNKVMKSNL